MLAVISPAKSLDFKTRPTTRRSGVPVFIDDAADLIAELAKLDASAVANLMDISQALGELNHHRYNSWRKGGRGAKQAVLAFTGDVYRGLEAWNFSAPELTSLQRRVRILSGLYGLLKPLDKIHPYRLEMGAAFANARGPDLYAFWGDRITEALNETLAGHRNKTLVNLASKEYWRAVRTDRLQAKVLHVRFLDNKNGEYGIISFFAKKARGLMAGYIAKNHVETVKALKAFDWHGYRYSQSHSGPGELTFIRDAQPSPAARYPLSPLASS